MENVKHKPCLVLNQDWKPLTVINWKRAICLGIVGEEVVGEGVRIVEWYSDDSVKSSGGRFIQVPAVAVSNRYVKYSHHWENIVISCRRCNAKKGNRTPPEAGMKLLSVPKKPNMAQFYSKSLISNSMPAEWKLYLK